MPLPILSLPKQTPDADLIRLFHKTESAWVEQLADPEQLEIGTAYACAELSSIWMANHVRDVALPPGVSPQQAWDEVQAAFTHHGTPCFFWTMNPSAPPERTEPMIDFLKARNFAPDPIDILYLRRRLPSPTSTPLHLQIIPARASYRHAEDLARQNMNEAAPGLEQLVQARLRRLDDAHFDSILALEEGQAVGGLGILTVGEIGRIENVFVTPQRRRQGIGRLMMNCALDACARSLFRHVFISVDPANALAIALYQSLGFERIGQMICHRPASNFNGDLNSSIESPYSTG